MAANGQPVQGNSSSEVVIDISNDEYISGQFLTSPGNVVESTLIRQPGLLPFAQLSDSSLPPINPQQSGFEDIVHGLKATRIGSPSVDLSEV